MKVIEEALDGIVLFEPAVFGDERGYFFESFRDSAIRPYLGDAQFVQDNESYSQRDVLRGLHFQSPPHEQGKLVRVTSGAALDVVVDIREDLASFGSYYSCVLSEENKRVLWVPPGFAHGFLSLKDNTRFLYKCTNYYNKESEGGLLWNDPEIGIEWPVSKPLVSEKDLVLPTLADLKTPFNV